MWDYSIHLKKAGDNIKERELALLTSEIGKELLQKLLKFQMEQLESLPLDSGQIFSLKKLFKGKLHDTYKILKFRIADKADNKQEYFNELNQLERQNKRN